MIEHFDNEPTVDPMTGYSERNTEWFEKHILPDFRTVSERLGCAPAWAKDAASLVDIGCAHGYFTKRYASLFREVVGIDFAPKRIAAAYRLNNAPNIRYYTIDIVRDTLRDIFIQFDVAISSGVLQHIDPKDRETAFQHIHDALKDGSTLILYDAFQELQPNQEWNHPWDGFTELLSVAYLDSLPNWKIADLRTIALGGAGEIIDRLELVRVS